MGPGPRGGVEEEPMSVDLAFVRRPRGGFGWVDHRIVSEGHLERLGRTETALYLVLCVVADRHGLSWYHPRRLARLIKAEPQAVESALISLASRGLVGLDGRYVQVLDLPEKPGDSRVLTERSPGLVVSAPEQGEKAPPQDARERFERLDEAERAQLKARAAAELTALRGGRASHSRTVEALAISYLTRRDG